jgi:hypothetical protein
MKREAREQHAADGRDVLHLDPIPNLRGDVRMVILQSGKELVALELPPARLRRLIVESQLSKEATADLLPHLDDAIEELERRMGACGGGDDNGPDAA